MKKEQKLYNLCKKFIKKQKITCAESIYQNDYIIENAYEFIENICDIIGYFNEENIEDYTD